MDENESNKIKELLRPYDADSVRYALSLSESIGTDGQWGHLIFNFFTNYLIPLVVCNFAKNNGDILRAGAWKIETKPARAAYHCSTEGITEGHVTLSLYAKIPHQ